MMVSLRNKGLWRNKQRKKDLRSLGFPCGAVSSSGDTTGGIDNLRTIDNAQEYLAGCDAEIFAGGKSQNFSLINYS